MDAVRGAATALFSSLATAILFAFCYRLPIPFVGMAGPFSCAKMIS